MTRTPALALLGGLYLAQGLPYGFFTQALPVLMREAGYSLKAISLTSLLFLPWLLKFLWAPLVDQLGRPRRWLLTLQGSTVLGALLLTQIDLGQGFVWLYLALLVFNLFAALQDTVTDGLAVRLLDGAGRGLGNGLQVGGYRLGMVLGGGGLLWVYAQSGWAPMFAGMALLLLLSALPVLWQPLPALAASPRPAPRLQPVNWWPRLRQPGFVAFIGLIAAYKAGDSFAASVVGPYMKDAGLSTATIALLKGTLGSGSALLGAVLGGWLTFRWPRRRALAVLGLAQTLAIAVYAVAVMAGHDPGLIALACVAEHLFGGMATVALFALMMDASDPDHASTDYTLLACAIVLVQGLAGFAAAVVGDAAGFAAVFILGTLASGAGCLALLRGLDAGTGPARLAAVWSPTPHPPNRG